MNKDNKWLIDTVNPALAISMKEAVLNSMTANDIYQAMRRRINNLVGKDKSMARDELKILLEALDAYEEAAEDVADDAEARP